MSGPWAGLAGAVVVLCAAAGCAGPRTPHEPVASVSFIVGGEAKPVRIDVKAHEGAFIADVERQARLVAMSAEWDVTRKAAVVIHPIPRTEPICATRFDVTADPRFRQVAESVSLRLRLDPQLAQNGPSWLEAVNQLSSRFSAYASSPRFATKVTLDVTLFMFDDLYCRRF